MPQTNTYFFKMRFKLFLAFSLLIVFTACKKESITRYTFEAFIVPANSGTVESSGATFEANTPLTLKAVAAEGYVFSHWSEGASGSENPLTLTADSNLSVTAHFIAELQEEVQAFEGGEIHNGYVFAVENGGTKAHIVNKSGEKLHSWTFDSRLGNDLEWLPNGNLLGIFKAEEELPFSFGGYGGVLKEFDRSQTILWEYKKADSLGLLHHDALKLPNGNILSMIWETIDAETAQAAGANVDYPIYPEKIVEINPTTNKIVWQWRAFEHLVQDHDPEADNYGNPATEIHKIDINYALRENGDLMHANGLAYDTERDLIYMSVNFYSEVWVLDHSQNTETTAGSAGDLMYRFGNPEAFRNTNATRLFYNNHHPHLIKESGSIMLYNNGTNSEQSSVVELQLPEDMSLQNASYTAPNVVWTYTHPDLFFGKISGAYRLSNGNTLICEGDYGYWEVNPEGDIVWKYASEVNVWRGYGIDEDDPRLDFILSN